MEKHRNYILLVTENIRSHAYLSTSLPNSEIKAQDVLHLVFKHIYHLKPKKLSLKGLLALIDCVIAFKLTSWFKGFHKRSVPAVTAIWPMQTTSKSSTSFMDGMFGFSSREVGGCMTSCETMGFNRTCERHAKRLNQWKEKTKYQNSNYNSLRMKIPIILVVSIFGSKFQKMGVRISHVSNHDYYACLRYNNNQEENKNLLFLLNIDNEDEGGMCTFPKKKNK